MRSLCVIKQWQRHDYGFHQASALSSSGLVDGDGQYNYKSMPSRYMNYMRMA